MFISCLQPSLTLKKENNLRYTLNPRMAKDIQLLPLVFWWSRIFEKYFVRNSTKQCMCVGEIVDLLGAEFLVRLCNTGFYCFIIFFYELLRLTIVVFYLPL